MDFTVDGHRISRYRGFSTFSFEENRSFVVTDVELIKTDLMNHIFTRKGERVMMPTYGTVIPDILFDPLDEELIDIVTDEVRSVIKFDPRVKLLDMEVRPDYDANSLVVALRIQYIELNTSDDFHFNIILQES